MLQAKKAKKLRLMSEVLKHLSQPGTVVEEGCCTSPGCTVWTTCSPDCCETNATK